MKMGKGVLYFPGLYFLLCIHDNLYGNEIEVSGSLSNLINGKLVQNQMVQCVHLSIIQSSLKCNHFKYQNC